MRAPVTGPRAAAPTWLIVRTDRLGETLLTLPALEAIRAARPAWHLLLMVQPAMRELLAGHPAVHEVVAEPDFGPRWQSRAWRMSRLWRSWRLDGVVVVNPKKEYHAAAWLSGVRHRVGFAQKWPGLLTRRVRTQKQLGDRHEVEYNLGLLPGLGIEKPATPKLWVPVREADATVVTCALRQRGIAAQQPLVVIHPWTSNPKKQWPLDRFDAVIRRVRETHGWPVVVIGGTAERRLTAPWTSRADDAGVIDATGWWSLGQLAALLARSRALISNDSGPVHLAAAVGARTVVLFGTSEPAARASRWRPWGDGHALIERPSMEVITVDEVWTAAAPILARRG